MPPLRLLKQSDLLQKSSNTMEVFQTSRDRSVVVEASAGTGKTFALEELVLELALVERIALQKILLVTLTEKRPRNCGHVCVPGSERSSTRLNRGRHGWDRKAAAAGGKSILRAWNN